MKTTLVIEIDDTARIAWAGFTTGDGPESYTIYGDGPESYMIYVEPDDGTGYQINDTSDADPTPAATWALAKVRFFAAVAEEVLALNG